MSKCFPKLTQTHVRLEVADGSCITVPMLPISDLSELKDCSELLKRAGSIEEFESLRVRLADLAKKVLPEPHRTNIERFDLTMLVELVTYLMYGDEDDLPKEEASKK